VAAAPRQFMATTDREWLDQQRHRLAHWSYEYHGGAVIAGRHREFWLAILSNRDSQPSGQDISSTAPGHSRIRAIRLNPESPETTATTLYGQAFMIGKNAKKP